MLNMLLGQTYLYLKSGHEYPVFQISYPQALSGSVNNYV